MAEKEPELVVNDRRKFTASGDLREGVRIADGPKPAEAVAPSAVPEPVAAEEVPAVAAEPEGAFADAEQSPTGQELPPGPTAEEIAEVKRAFETTADRLDTAVRAQNLGGEHLPPMTFERLIQSLYMTAMMQLGAGTPQGEKARVDLLGARQSIDMLKVIEEKSESNRSADETKLLAHALFELRMAFLEITQALTRSAQAKAAGTDGAGTPGMPGGPKLVR